MQGSSISPNLFFPSICVRQPASEPPWRWILTTSCPQQIIVSAVELIFLFIMLLLGVHRAITKLTKSRTSPPRADVVKVGNLFIATLLVASLATLINLGFESWLLWLRFSRSTNVAPVDIISSAVQIVKWLVFVALVAHEKKFHASLHPLPLRAWWVTDFVLFTILFISALLRITPAVLTYEYVNDLLSVIMFPVSLFFLVLAVRGKTGILTHDQTTGLTEPLLVHSQSENTAEKLPVTGYATANIFSRATWSWLSPVLKKGYSSQLQIRDIPLLAAEDRAETSYAKFSEQWPETPGSSPVRNTLLRCFGRDLAMNGLLAFIRLCVMYAGPVLIQRFVDFTSGNSQGSRYEGYYLVLILLAAKMTEVLSSHQYSFQSQKLGMTVRAAIAAAVYQKSLRISNSSKQGHGFGHIVNYMSVDAQQLSDLVFQLHNLWMLPAQVLIALAILYNELGVPMLAGFAVMVTIIIYNFYCTQKQLQFQIMLMRFKDKRMKATGEVLSFMKIIKFQAWEDYFLKRVEDCREEERTYLVKFLVLFVQGLVAMSVVGSLVALVTFGACILVNVELNSANVFTAISTFRIMQEPIRNFPQALMSISQSMVSLNRLDKFMVSEERDESSVEKLPRGSDTAVNVENGNFSWEADQPASLKDINFNVQRGQLVAVVGTVGSGKSSLLTAVLGEMLKLSGKVQVSESTAYVQQTAWIQNATIEDNILFGLPMVRSKYMGVIRACALEADLKLMEFGDQTEIGERGINLSGGQKQRIQLARALYQDEEVYLLDDVFSAVDAHTGTHLFQECVLKALKERGKTVLLVTHQVEFLHAVDMILVLRDGNIVQAGKYDDLMKEGTDLEALVAAHHTAMESISLEEEGDAEVETASQSQVQQIKKSLSLQRRPSTNKQLKGSAKLVDEEQRELGRVGWKVYWIYFTKAFGWPTLPTLLLMQVLFTVASVASDYWLSIETSSETGFSPKRFLLVYFILSATSWVLAAARSILQTVAGLKTAQSMFTEMLRRIFRSPMLFFDTTPSGRILSRASTDQLCLDILLPIFVGSGLSALIGAASSLVVTCQVTWPIIFLVIPLIWTFISYQTYYLSTSRELTRLTSITRAPIIVHFSETLSGLGTVRAFKKEARFAQVNIDLVNTNICMDFHNNAANEWLGFRLEMIGSTVLCVSALLLVALPGSIVQPEKTGLSLSYGLSLNSMLFYSVWLLCNMENKMVAVERIRQYTTIESEAPPVNESYRPPPKWPTRGTISVQNLQFRYRPNTPLVLRGVTLRIQGGSKVGVVGRTGSGKSTLIQAFFRLVEPCGGVIIIDDIDILKLGLADLRSRFGIIPQEPILFEGSVRSNVDPLGQYNDDRVWEVLRKCQLAEPVQRAGGLDSAVSDNGDNWSVGQKQLFCLARALLKDSRILFLDEATASVDSQTDAIIQETIKEQFSASTVISVAHRIPSVMSSDKVLVMGEGEVKEYDRPSVLLERPNSLFAALVREYASRSNA